MSEIRVITPHLPENEWEHERDEDHFKYYRDVLKFPEEVDLPQGTDFMLVVLRDDYLPDTITRQEFPDQFQPPYGRERVDLTFDPPRTVHHEIIERYVEGLEAERHRAFVVRYKQSWFYSNGEDDWDEPARIVIQIFGVETGCLAELTRLFSDNLSAPHSDSHVIAEWAEWEQESYDDERLAERERGLEKRLNKVDKLSEKLAKLTPFEREMVLQQAHQ